MSVNFILCYFNEENQCMKTNKSSELSRDQVVREQLSWSDQSNSKNENIKGTSHNNISKEAESANIQ